MRFNLLTLGAFATTTTLAAPALNAEKRQVGNVLQIVQATYKQVTQYTSVINSTLDSTKVDGVSAAGLNVSFVEATLKAEIASIVHIIDSVLDVTVGLTVIDDVDSVLNVITSITEGLPAVSYATGWTNRLTSIVKRLVPDLNLDSVTDLVKGVPVVGARDGLVPDLGLDAVTGDIAKGLPVVGKRQTADINGVTGYATSMVTEITSTVAGVSKLVPGVQLGDSITTLSVALTTLITDLDNIVDGVEIAVTNVLKNVPVSVSVLDTTVDV